MDEQERLGRPYWQCRSCPYGSLDRAYVEAHLRDHEVRPTLDEVLAAAAAPPALPARSRKQKES